MDMDKSWMTFVTTETLKSKILVSSDMTILKRDKIGNV